MHITIDPPDAALLARLSIAWCGIALSRVRCTCGREFYCRTVDRLPHLDGQYLERVRAHVMQCKHVEPHPALDSGDASR